jgi:glycosyltransferase involved in cell wall biosynthesis
MLRAVLRAISVSFKSGGYLGVVLAYPYTVPSIKSSSILEYIFSLLILKIFSISSTRVNLIVDVFDPSVEIVSAFGRTSPSVIEILYMRSLEKLTLIMASSVIVLSNSYQQYIPKIYHIRKNKVFVLSTGSLVKCIKYVPHQDPAKSNSFRVLYAGSAMKQKDIDKLVSMVAELKREGLQLELHIAGAKLMDLPQWVHIAQYDWPTFIEHEVAESDVCVIPYPPNKLHFSYTSIAKLFDYMAVGKPIISTNLIETGRIIRMFNCGLVAKDWGEFKLHLKKLYYNRQLARELGENGRRAVQKHFDYELLANRLLNKIIVMFIEENK